MKRGVVEAKETKETKKKGGNKKIKTLGRTMAAFLAAGVALIALTDKAMTKAYPQEDEEEEQNEGK